MVMNTLLIKLNYAENIVIRVISGGIPTLPGNPNNPNPLFTYKY